MIYLIQFSGSYITSEIKQRPSWGEKRYSFFASASSSVNCNSITFDRVIKQLMTIACHYILIYHLSGFCFSLSWWTVCFWMFYSHLLVFVNFFFIKIPSIRSCSFSSVQSLSHIRRFATPWTAVHQASLSFTNSSYISYSLNLN